MPPLHPFEQLTASRAIPFLTPRCLPSHTHAQLFTVMISALVHDVDHPGTNNDFEQKTSSRLALLYNDTSCLENHHLALTFNILALPHYNIFELWWDEERREARKLMTNAVLNTDMALHNSLRLDLEARSLKQPAPYNLARFDDRMELVKIILHTADIFNVARPCPVSVVISQQVIAEFKNQVTKERALGVPMTPWMVMDSRLAECEGELGFARYSARPYFAALAAVFPDNPKVNWLRQIDENIVHYSGEIDRLRAGDETK